MNEIGGYFGLEINNGIEYHSNAIHLNTGRNCLEYILRAKQIKKIYVPYYTCDVILEPIKKLGIVYEFYSIDKNFNPIFSINTEEDEAFLYTNYFGVKTKKVIELSFKIINLIIDNSQAFFADPVPNIDTFYSARKFFGVPDGAYLYTNTLLNEELNQDESYTRCAHLLKRIDLGASSGYADFTSNDKVLENLPILRMSKLTKSILTGIDYERIKNIRLHNFKFLHKSLSHLNELTIDSESESPMIYPFLLSGSNLKSYLIKNRIFVATYWPNVLKWIKPDSLERHLSKYLIPLPIDQRYDEEILSFMVDKILKFC